MTLRAKLLAGAFCLVAALLAGGAFSAARAEEPGDLLENLQGLPGGFPSLGGQDDKVKVAAQIIAGKDGSPVLEVRAEVPDEWHLYSTTQPSGGPLKTEIKVDPPIKLAGPFQPNRPPHQTTVEVFAGIPIEQYEGLVVWSAPLAAGGPALDQLRLTGTLNGQICRDGEKNAACIPVSEKFTAAYHPNAVSFVPAGSSGTYIDKANELTIRGHLEPSTIAPGGKAKLVLSIEPKEGWHTYPWSATKSSKGSKPTLIVPTNKSGFTFGEPTTTSPVLEGPALVAGEPAQRYHDGTVTWTVEITAPADAKPVEYPISGLMGYQVCSKSTCLAPSGVSFDGKLAIGTPSTEQAPLTFQTGKYSAAEKALAAAPKAAEAPMSLPWILGAALLGGLILNLMPCVLPVIGLKILSFAEQAGQSRMQVLALNLWYALGVLVVFWILAGMAVFLNLAWGEQFQATWFNVLMTGVVFAMGLSFLGVWEIPVPGFATSDKASDLADHEGALGAFFKGMLTTVLSTPCSGPLLGAVFSYLVTQSPLVSFLVFTCIGLGMASPYILVGLEPSLIRFIPKPGEWMNTFKHVMGFVMMGAAVLLLASVAKDYRIATLTFLVGLSASCWLIGKIPVGSEWPETIQGWSYATALSVLIGLVSFQYLGPNEFELPWKKWEPARAETLAKEGKTVLVDFTADWCLTCKANLKFAINTQAVNAAVKEKGVVPLLADWTSPNEEIKAALLGLNNSNSIPVLAIYPAGRPEDVIILRDVVTQAAILEALDKAGPSHDASLSAKLTDAPAKGDFAPGIAGEASLQKAGPSQSAEKPAASVAQSSD